MRFLSLAIVCFQLSASPVLADEAAASSAFAAGEAAFAGGRNQEALAHFRRAFSLAPHDAVRFNVAVCLERLGRLREAVREYEAAAASAMLSPDEREHARGLAAAVRLRLVTVTVEGAPSGTALFVDGQRECNLPCTLALDPGAHALTSTRADGVSLIGHLVAQDGAAERVVLLPENVRENEPTRPPQRDDTHRFPSLLTVGGAAVALAAIGSTVGFGVAALRVHDDECTPYCPDGATQARGELWRNLANASLAGLAVAGGIVIADVVWAVVDEAPWKE